VGVPWYHEAHLVRIFPSCLGSGNWRPGGLLVSPFNVTWRFSALLGDVEGSKLCLFSVILPAKCFSSVSPRFHYRRLAFCFLPLAAILESSIAFNKRNLKLYTLRFLGQFLILMDVLYFFALDYIGSTHGVTYYTKSI
jgi:hypothetical protein